MAAYLIDYENVKSEGIRGILQLSEQDTVIIFYSNNADTLTFETMDMIFASKATVRKYKIVRGGKNALDFQLSTYLGYLIHEAKDSFFYIISKDHGFQHVIEFWKRTFNYEGYVYCFATIADAYARHSRFDHSNPQTISQELLIHDFVSEEIQDAEADTIAELTQAASEEIQDAEADTIVELTQAVSEEMQDAEADTIVELTQAVSEEMQDAEADTIVEFTQTVSEELQNTETDTIAERTQEEVLPVPKQTPDADNLENNTDFNEPDSIPVADLSKEEALDAAEIFQTAALEETIPAASVEESIPAASVEESIPAASVETAFPVIPNDMIPKHSSLTLQEKIEAAVSSTNFKVTVVDNAPTVHQVTLPTENPVTVHAVVENTIVAPVTMDTAAAPAEKQIPEEVSIQTASPAHQEQETLSEEKTVPKKKKHNRHSKKNTQKGTEQQSASAESNSTQTIHEQPSAKTAEKTDEAVLKNVPAKKTPKKKPVKKPSVTETQQPAESIEQTVQAVKASKKEAVQPISNTNETITAEAPVTPKKSRGRRPKQHKPSAAASFTD